MIDKSILEQLKQSNVGKNKEKTQERMKVLWKSLDKSKREEISEYSGLTKYTFERSYKEGNISAKLAVAVAEIVQVNPFYLTGEEDEKDDYSEEKIREFLISKNYGGLVGRAVKSRRKAGRKKNEEELVDSAISGSEKDTTDIVPISEAVHEEELIDTELSPDESNETTPVSKQATGALAVCFDSLLVRIQDKVQNVTNEKKDLLSKMPEDEVQSLIKALHLRAKYDEDAELLVALTNLIITSM